MTLRFYDRNGTRLASAIAWGALFESVDYQVVRQDTVKGRDVSTVWMGYVRDANEDPPLIFETQVFVAGSRTSECGPRICYASEADAIAGHQLVVQRLLDDTSIRG